MKSIKVKLIVYFSLLILVASAALSVMSLERASEAIQNEVDYALSSFSHDAAKLTQSRLETQKKTLEMIAERAEIQSMDWAIQQPIIQSQLKNTNFLDIAVVQPDGTATYTDGSTSQLGDREYIKKAFAGELNVSDLLISKVTNSVVLMYAAPIKQDGKVVGVLVGRGDGTALSSITDDIKYGESGYAYMINSKGVVVAHPDKERVLKQWNPIEDVKNDESQKPVAEAFEHMIKEKSGISAYKFLGNEIYVAFTPVEGSDWIIATAAYKNEIFSDISSLQKATILFTGIIYILSVVIAFAIGSSITKPIIKSVKHLEKIAKLDLTEDVPAGLLKSKDEIGTLSKALQLITNSLRDTIKEIGYSSEQLAAASEELTATSQQSSTAAEEISKTVEEIARGAADQARSTEEGSSKAIMLGNTVEKDQELVMNLNTTSKKVADVVGEGLKEIDNLSKITEESNEATKEIYEVIQKTNDSSTKIGEASSVIASIAEQTNLLALNAAIEAARAGEAGKGFAVVADEIRKLAEQSANSTKAIDEVVKELQINAQEAVMTMERVRAIATEQNDSVVNSKNKYVMIEQAMAEAMDAVKELNASGQALESMKNEILDTLQSLSAIAEENSAATQQATASMEEQSASMEEIAGSSESLSDLAQNLQSIIAKFKV